MGLGGFEPPTSPLSGVRSNQLSYRPKQLSTITANRYTAAFRYVLVILVRAGRPKVRLSTTGKTKTGVWTLNASGISFKEVIQPQVPLGLPCYDFTPVMNHSVVIALPKVRLTTSGATHSHGVTGGVYKARERIHRDILIRDY